MKKSYEKPFVRDLGEDLLSSTGQQLCSAGSTDFEISCTNGNRAQTNCHNGNTNLTGFGCHNGNNNSSGPGTCGNGSNVI